MAQSEQFKSTVWPHGKQPPDAHCIASLAQSVDPEPGHASRFLIMLLPGTPEKVYVFSITTIREEAHQGEGGTDLPHYRHRAHVKVADVDYFINSMHRIAALVNSDVDNEDKRNELFMSLESQYVVAISPQVDRPLNCARLPAMNGKFPAALDRQVEITRRHDRTDEEEAAARLEVGTYATVYLRALTAYNAASVYGACFLPLSRDPFSRDTASGRELLSRTSADDILLFRKAQRFFWTQPCLFRTVGEQAPSTETNEQPPDGRPTKGVLNDGREEDQG